MNDQYVIDMLRIKLEQREEQIADLKARISECRSVLWFYMAGTDVRFSRYPYLTKVTDLRVKNWKPQ